MWSLPKRWQTHPELREAAPETLPLLTRYLDRKGAVHKGAGHFCAKLFRSRGKLPATVWTDKFDRVCGEFDVLRSWNHEFFVAVWAIEHGMIEFFPGGEAGGTMRAFKTEWHNGTGSIFHTSPLHRIKAEKLKRVEFAIMRETFVSWQTSVSIIIAAAFFRPMLFSCGAVVRTGSSMHPRE